MEVVNDEKWRDVINLSNSEESAPRMVVGNDAINGNVKSLPYHVESVSSMVVDNNA